MFLDVVQFSKRSAEAQSEIVQRLNEVVFQSLNSHKISIEDDSILIPTGDGMCIALISRDLPYDIHIQVAMSILKGLSEYNERTQNESRHLQVRIGINQNTDIVVTDINGRRNIAGAGINIASRIMDKADGGQILVSQAVLHELEPSEIYMNKFVGFTATGKHNLSFQVHQYTAQDQPGLNTDTPSTFARRQPERKKLSEQAAHYLVHAIVHKQDLLNIKARRSFYWDSSAIVLLRMLANDSYEISKSSEFDEKRMGHYAEGTGIKSFEEQYDYYNSQNTWVRRDAKSLVISGSLAAEGLELADYSECFEVGEMERHYEFVSVKGMEKLKQEWPKLWRQFDLDRYVG